MELIEKLTNKLNTEMDRVFAEYAVAHEEFAKCVEINQGKPINDCKDELNVLLKVVQDKFASLWPAYHFIDYRHQSAMNAVTGFTSFIENIKKSGAEQQDPNTSKIIAS